MLSNSFTWWLVNLGVTIAWLAGSVVSGSYILALGAFVYIGLMILLELPDTSSEEGSADEDGDGMSL